MNYKHPCGTDYPFKKKKRPCGSEFRKRKKENEEKAKKHPKIHSFFQSESITDCSSSVSNDKGINLIKDAVLRQDSELLLDELRAAEVNKNENSSCNFENNKIETDSDFQENINFVSSKSRSRLPKIPSIFPSDSVSSCSSSVSIYNESYIKNADLHKDPQSVLQESEAAFVSLQVHENESASYNYESDKAETGSDIQENLDLLSSSREADSVDFNHKTSDIGLFLENDILKECVKVFILNSKSCKPQAPFPKDKITKRYFS